MVREERALSPGRTPPKDQCVARETAPDREPPAARLSVLTAALNPLDFPRVRDPHIPGPDGPAGLSGIYETPAAAKQRRKRDLSWRWTCRHRPPHRPIVRDYGWKDVILTRCRVGAGFDGVHYTWKKTSR
jgi:hypothetical protein